MKDAATHVFVRFKFMLTFYFRYVDDTILCIPKDALHVVMNFSLQLSF